MNGVIASESVEAKTESTQDHDKKVNKRAEIIGIVLLVGSALLVQHGKDTKDQHQPRVNTLVQNEQKIRVQLNPTESTLFDSIRGQISISQVNDAIGSGMNLDEVNMVERLRTQYDQDETEKSSLQEPGGAEELVALCEGAVGAVALAFGLLSELEDAKG